MLVILVLKLPRIEKLEWNFKIQFQETDYLLEWVKISKVFKKFYLNFKKLQFNVETFFRLFIAERRKTRKNMLKWEKQLLRAYQIGLLGIDPVIHLFISNEKRRNLIKFVSWDFSLFLSPKEKSSKEFYSKIERNWNVISSSKFKLKLLRSCGSC